MWPCIVIVPASSRNQNSTLQRSHSHVFLPQDEDSNSSWTSTGSSTRKKSRLTGPSPFKSHGSLGPSRDGSSESDEEGEKRRKVRQLVIILPF